MRRRSILPAVSGLLALVVCLTAALPAQAKEAEEIAVYHERTATEDEAVDNWYSLTRGVYLSYGTSKIKAAGPAKVTISGSTVAYSFCDELRLALYLDESPSNNNDYDTIGVYHYSRKNDSAVSGVEENISVTKGYYYSARGSHTAVEGGKTESVSSETDPIIAK